MPRIRPASAQSILYGEEPKTQTPHPLLLVAQHRFALFCEYRTENAAHTTREPLAPWLFAVTPMGWCLPEFLPCWAYCSAKSSRHGKRPPRSAFLPSQPQCQWHRTSHSGHHHFWTQGKELVKCCYCVREHPKHISVLSLFKHEWFMSPTGRAGFSNLLAAPVGLVWDIFCFWPFSQLLLLNSALTANHAAQLCYSLIYIGIRKKTHP